MGYNAAGGFAVGTFATVGVSGSGSAAQLYGAAVVESGTGESSNGAAFRCSPNYLTSRHEDNIVYIDTGTEFWVKSHPLYSTYDYPLGLDCHVSFRAKWRQFTQYITFEVVEGALGGDAFIAFGNDYGDFPSEK